MKTVIVFIALSCAILGKAQLYRQANVWYTWDKTGLDFNTKPPSAIINKDTSINDVSRATICSRQGRMLFYSDGNKVWDSTHSVMKGGENIGGDYATLSLIANKPGSYSSYFLFSLQPINHSFSYAEIDMTRNNGKGEVVSKNNLIDTDIETNHFAATMHSNGSDYWLIYMNKKEDAMYAFLVSKNGVNQTPVISIRNIIGRAYFPLYCIKASPDHKRVAVNGMEGITYILDFNNSTGSLILSDTIQNNSSRNIEFSPDSRFLYKANENGDIDQYDLQVKGSIGSSKITLYNTSGDLNLTGLQLGPDNKIYGSCTGGSSFHCIPKPNEKGTACGYSSNTIFLGGQRSSFQLPIWLNKEMMEITHTCLGDSTKLSYSTYAVEADSVLWDFGDSVTLGNNNSRLFNASHVFSDTGNFKVRLIAYLPGKNADTTFSPVHITHPYFTLGRDTLLCEHSHAVIAPLNIKAQIPFTYLWHDSTRKSNFKILHDEKMIILSITDAAGCQAADTLNITYKQNPEFSLGNDTDYCNTKQAVLIIHVTNAQYRWNNGSSGNQLIVTGTGRYFATVTQNGCSYTDTVNIRFADYPVIDMGNDDSICGTFKKVIDLSGQAEKYEWSTGNQKPIEIINELGRYTIRAANASCYAYDTINLYRKTRFDMFIPNAFSANGDLLNDLFKPVTDLQKYEIEIYSRWGELIFRGAEGWDGSFNLKPCPAGVYVYIIKYDDCYNMPQYQRGTITLIK